MIFTGGFSSLTNLNILSPTRVKIGLVHCGRSVWIIIRGCSATGPYLPFDHAIDLAGATAQ